VKAVKPKLVDESTASIEDQLKDMTPSEKSKVADRIYNHILNLMDRKIQDSGN